MEGVEAAIDKDRTAALLAVDLEAEALLLLTGVPTVFRDYSGSDQGEIGDNTPEELDALDLAPGSMSPKVAAASVFVRKSAKFAGIDSLADARAILEGHAGTRVFPNSANHRRKD